LTGFTTDYINLIATNLRDQYKTGFPILKELVQNADDEGATALAFGYHDGFGEAVDHDLLRGPALWVFNDGGFCEGDGEAIRSFGVNDKAADTGSIGKFGLGMKSVFHLCESFFYCASDGRRDFDAVLNPWIQNRGNDPMHEKWEVLSDRDRISMRGVVAAQPEFATARTWLMLWIPLRRRTHVTGDDGETLPAIVDRFPGDIPGEDLDFLSERNVDQRIAYLLPLLRNLRQVRSAGMHGSGSFEVRLHVKEGAPRLDHESDDMQVGGRVTDASGKQEYLKFLARQAAPLPAPPFDVLKSANAWPKSMTIGSGKRDQVPDKARPEAAILVGCTDNKPGSLVIEWAVFLPLETTLFSYRISIENISKEFRIVLHGQFFVDKGRQGLSEMEALHSELDAPSVGMTSNALVRTWNQALAQKVLLPLLPKVLSMMTSAWGLRDPEISGLTRAIHECAPVGARVGAGFFPTFRRFLCSKQGWARILQPEGALWREVGTAESKDLYPIPAPPFSAKDRPWIALPGLKHVARAIYIDDSAPALLNSVPVWSQESFEVVLRSINPDTLGSSVELAYLVRFLEPQRDKLLGLSAVQDVFAAALRRCVSAAPLQALRQNRSDFRSLIALLTPDRIFPVGTRDTDARGAVAEVLYKSLLSCPTYAMPLPADLCDSQPRGKFLTADLIAWLQVISAENRSAVSEGGIESRLDLAEEIIESAGAVPDQASLISSVRDLAILRVVPVGTHRRQAVSLNSLLETQRNQLLFKSASVIDQTGFIPQLMAALPEAKPLLIKGRLAGMIEDVEHPAIQIPSTASAGSIVAAVGAAPLAPKLGGNTARLRLLESVAAADLSDVAAVRGMRYLLHGESSGYRSDDVLWKDPSSQNSVWIKLWRMTSAKTWEVLSSPMCAVLSDNQLKKLNIRVVDEASVVARLVGCQDLSRVDGTEFTGAELDAVLSAVDDESVWRQLPLHRDRGGRLQRADASCYLGHEPPLPIAFAAKVRFIEPSTNPGHAHKQKQWLAPWSATQAASIVLASPDAAKHWGYLLDLLASNLGLQRNPPTAWRTVPWLPLKTGNAISLDSLIVLEGMAGDIDGLSRECDYAFAGPDALLDSLWSHRAGDLLRSQIASGADALPVLGQLMSEAGLSGGTLLISDFKTHELPLSALAGLQSLPAWRIVQKAIAATSAAEVEQRLLGEVGRPLSPEEAETCLAELAARGRGSSQAKLAASVLREWAQSTTVAELSLRLPTLRLPSEAGDWRPAAELAAGVYAVEPSSVLERSAAKALSGLIVQNDSPPDIQGEVLPTDTEGWNGTKLEATLRFAFDDLAERSARPGVGAVVGLFGHLAESLCREWLGDISYEDYLAKLDWRDPGYEKTAERRLFWMGGKTLDQALRTIKFTVRVDDGETAEVRTIVGGVQLVNLLPAAQSGTLLAGALWWQMGNGVVVTLRNPSTILECDSDEQRRILQRTAEELLSSLYNQKHASLDSLWALFSKADQVTLGVARSLIMEGLPQLLRSLPGVPKSPKIQSALKRLDIARRDRASSRVAERDSDRPQHTFDEASAALGNLVETDVDVQATILDGIRKKVELNQYERSSIAFELFQNADDAVGELQRLREREGRARFDRDDVGRFVVGFDGSTHRFVHWGRPINYTGRLEDAESDYGNDLERMLMLGASSKSDDNLATGKFGLGFKSVLLATSAPRVSSGDLRFEVVAGCLPHRWDLSAESNAFLKAGQSSAKNSLRPTLVELSLDNDVARIEVAAKFLAHHGLLAVFAHNIRRIQIDEIHTAWTPQVICESDAGRIEVGITSLPAAGGNLQERVVAFRCRDGIVALRLAANGFVSFDGKADHPIPAVWVTTPTRGQPARGVAITAKFAIDTGRATLASGKNSEHNRRLAISLASQVAELVAQLQEMTEQDWGELKERLGCTSVESASAFWTSFWKSLLDGAPDESTADDLTLIDQFATSTLKGVLQERPEVPNGLPGNLGGIVRLDELQLAVNVTRYGQVIPAIQAWTAFETYCPHTKWCSAEVLDWLRRSAALSNEQAVEEFGYGTVRAAMHEGRLRPQDVSAVASILAAWPNGLEVNESWRAKFLDVTLMTKATTWSRASRVLREPDRDEFIRRFASDDAVAAIAYAQDRAAWTHLNSLLPYWSRDEAEVARWCLLAVTESARRAAACWLLQNSKVWAFFLVKRDLAGTWIESLEIGHPALDDLNPSEQLYVLSALGLVDDAEAEPDDETDPLVDLPTIHRWWVANRTRWIPKVQAGMWPNHVDPQSLLSENADRSAWMVLFCLALFQRYGRATNQQHRGFLQFLNDKGWWDTICNVDPDEAPEAWMDILKQYAEDRTVDGLFEQWMDSFHRVYRIARWFEAYVHIARTLDQRDETEIVAWLTPSQDPVLTGSDIDAPTLSRMLRMGQHLLIRELLRVGVLESPDLFRFAYMPGRAVLDLMANLGAPDLESSEDIYDALVDEIGEECATFEGDFDLPLQLIATNSGMLDKIAEWADANPGDETLELEGMRS
jgi:hypothetical protein